MTQELLTYFFGGALGVMLNILFKVQNLKKHSKAANHSFSFKSYISDDWPSILISLVVVGIGVYTIKEMLAIKPELAKYIKWFFVFVGYSGSSVIQSVFSVASKKLSAVIDIKTNIADEIKPAVDASNVEGVKEIQKDQAKLSEHE